jgi:peptide/nickel transport system substrate-binding protein
MAALMLGTACATPAPPPAQDRAAPPTASTVSEPRGTLKLAWSREAETLSPKFLAGGGAGEYTWLFSSALVMRDFANTPRPMLAREMPTQENGDWIVNPDGTMVTTYRLREDARWHDGTPITAADYAFAYRVYTDPAMPVGVRHPESLMSSVEARDDYTLVINWRESFVGANALGYRQLHPLPSHIFAEKYRTNHEQFTTGDEWTYRFVGSGPYKVEAWEPGAYLIARAHREFVTMPKIDRIEIRFIADQNTILANLLADEIDMAVLLAAQAVVANEQWVSQGKGYLTTWSKGLQYYNYQFREVPNRQRAMSDVRVRQALAHAVDRPALADVSTFGLGRAADAYVAPAEPFFEEVDRTVTKYPYDLNRAAALLADAGWRRSGSTGPLTNGDGEPFDITVQGDQRALIIADGWKLAGLNATPFEVPNARARDNEFVNSFPGVQIVGNTISQEELSVVSSKLPTAELNWMGSNRGSFVDAEIDRLHNIILTSLNESERRQAIVAVHKRVSDLVPYQPLYYSAETALAKNNVKGPFGEAVGFQSGVTWNVYEWEITN